MQEKSNAGVVDKTSPLFVGIRAIPSFKARAAPGSSLNVTDHKISELRKKIKKKDTRPSQDTADANVAARTAAAAPTKVYSQSKSTYSLSTGTGGKTRRRTVELNRAARHLECIAWFSAGVRN